MVVLPELERRRTARLERRADRKRQRVANDGRPRTVTPVHKVLMTLIYLRHNGHCQLNGSQPDMTTIYCGHDFF